MLDSVDGCYDMGSGPKQTVEQQELYYPLSQCMSCGCCLEACPQFQKVFVKRNRNENDEEYERRCNAALDSHFISAAAMSQGVLMNSSPNGQALVNSRIEAMIAPGGIQNCGKAGNCQAVCLKEIPLMHSWGRANRTGTLQVIKKLFDG